MTLRKNGFAFSLEVFERMDLIWIVTLLAFVVDQQTSASASANAKKKTETIISAGDWVSVDEGSGTFNNKWDF